MSLTGLGHIFTSYSSGDADFSSRPGPDAFTTRRLNSPNNAGPAECFLVMPVGEVRGFEENSDKPAVSYPVYGTVPVDASTLNILAQIGLSYPKFRDRTKATERADLENSKSESEYLKDRIGFSRLRWEEPTTQTITIPAAANPSPRKNQNAFSV